MTEFAKFLIDFNMLITLFTGLHLGIVGGQVSRPSLLLCFDSLTRFEGYIRFCLLCLLCLLLAYSSCDGTWWN